MGVERLRGEGGAVPDRVLGAAGIIMILAAFYVLLFGGPPDTGAVVTGPIPEIEFLEPAAGAVVDQPVEMRFSVDARLAPQPGGWGTDGLHLHAALNGRELMPRTEDIRRVDGGQYVWVLPPLPAGSHTLSLFWSDINHAPIEGSGTDTRQVRVR